MEESGWLTPEESATFRGFSRMSRRLFVQFDQDLQREAGMRRTYFEILWLLRAAPERSLRMSDLATSTGSHPSRISHAVGKLEEKGLVLRELCTADRRGWFAILTDEGEAAVTKVAPKYAMSIRKHLLEPLSDLEREQLTSIAESVLQDLPVQHRSETASSVTTSITT